jgi:hypothetical protein
MDQLLDVIMQIERVLADNGHADTAALDRLSDQLYELTR